MTDTDPEIAKMVRGRLMALSGAERIRMGAQMFEAARRMILASFPPELSETERKRRLFERVYGCPLPGQTEETNPTSLKYKSYSSTEINAPGKSSHELFFSRVTTS